MGYLNCVQCRDVKMTLLKIMFVCSVVVGAENDNSGWKFKSDNEGVMRIGFSSNDLEHCRPADKAMLSKHNAWIASLLTIKLKEIQNVNAERQATKMNENEEYHKQIMKHLAANPYSMVNQNSLPNFKIGSDDLSTQDHAKNRVKRMNENEEIDNLQLQANIEEVFKTSSLDASKEIDNNLIDEIPENDPALHETINNVFGSAPSERLLAQNVKNYDNKNNNHLNEETDTEELDSSIEDYDSTTKKTNLNEMILKNFGPELLDDDPESTTEYRFRDIPTLLDKYKNMTETNNHDSNKDTSLSGDGNHASNTKNPDADTVKAGSRSSGGLASTTIPYLITLILILVNQ